MKPATPLVAAGVALAIGAGCWGARTLFHLAILRGLRAPRTPHDTPLHARALAGGRIEPIQLHGARGRRLAAWVAWPDGAGPGPVPAVLVMHGWGANASTMWPVVPPLVAAGIAVLLLDARCHGDSDDEPFTSMPRFAQDIGAALHRLRGHPGLDPDRVALLGHSVGAGAALLHARRPAPSVDGACGVSEIRAVVSLSAFAQPREMMLRFLAEHRVPYPLVGWYVLRHVQRVIGARFDDIAPLRSIAQVRCPVLLVHGRQDSTVPFGDALRLREAKPDAELLGVDADHDLRDALLPHTGEIVRFLRGALAAPAPGARAA